MGKKAEEKLSSVISSDRRFIGLDQEKTEYNLTGTDFSSGRATVDISFVGYMAMKKADNLVEREKLIGLNEAQIRDYLIRSEKFSDFKIIFSPSFMKKAPSLVDKINIVVKE
jgi:hypothetical protein